MKTFWKIYYFLRSPSYKFILVDDRTHFVSWISFSWKKKKIVFQPTCRTEMFLLQSLQPLQNVKTTHRGEEKWKQESTTKEREKKGLKPDRMKQAKWLTLMSSYTAVYDWHAHLCCQRLTSERHPLTFSFVGFRTLSLTVCPSSLVFWVAVLANLAAWKQTTG